MWPNATVVSEYGYTVLLWICTKQCWSISEIQMALVYPRSVSVSLVHLKIRIPRKGYNVMYYVQLDSCVALSLCLKAWTFYNGETRDL